MTKRFEQENEVLTDNHVILNSFQDLRNRFLTKFGMTCEKRRGFTLAEVLITLGIIGVVAAMTLPSLIQNYKKQTYVTGLKKAVNVVSNGFRAIMAEEGVTEFTHTSLFSSSNPTNSARNEDIDTAIKKHFNTIKTCKYGDDSCEIEGYRLLNGSSYGFAVGSADYYSFYTADGMVVELVLYSTPGTFNGIGYCGDVYVDINGPKKPNQVGRDYFYFQIDRDGSLYPSHGQRYAEYQTESEDWASFEGYWKNAETCGTEGSTDVSSSDGWGCAARIIEEGWVMSY